MTLKEYQNQSVLFPQAGLFLEEGQTPEGIFKDIYNKGKRPQWEMKSLIPKSTVDD